MQDNLCIAISGTPGCGKSSLSEVFTRNGATILSVKDLAQQHDCLGELDPSDGANEIDIHRLAETWELEGDGLVIIDGHLSHFLEVDAIVLLRCNPNELEKRLTRRGYSKNKVNANIEWELIAGIWSELLEFEIELPIIEFDTTTISTDEIYEKVNDWIDQNFPYSSVTAEAEGAIDWINP